MERVGDTEETVKLPENWDKQNYEIQTTQLSTPMHFLNIMF